MIYCASTPIPGVCGRNPQLPISAVIRTWWKTLAASCTAPAGKRTPSSKSSIFNWARARRPVWLTPPVPRVYAGKELRARRAGFQLRRDILQRRKRHEQMYLLARRLDVNLQFSVACADLDVFLAVHDLDQVDVG